MLETIVLLVIGIIIGAYHDRFRIKYLSIPWIFYIFLIGTGIAFHIIGDRILLDVYPDYFTSQWYFDQYDGHHRNMFRELIGDTIGLTLYLVLLASSGGTVYLKWKFKLRNSRRRK